MCVVPDIQPIPPDGEEEMGGGGGRGGKASAASEPADIELLEDGEGGVRN